MLTTDQKGSIAEASIAAKAIKLGIEVYKPLIGGCRTDLIFGVGRHLLRVQCKWAARHGDVLTIRCYSSRRTRSGLVKRGYNADEVDVIAAYCMTIDRCFALPPE